MKHRAIVIFADGSKRMAHNTDDLMFRWHERKIKSHRDLDNIIEHGIYIPDCSAKNEITEDNAVSIRSLLIAQKMNIHEQIIFANSNSKVSAKELANIKAAQMVIDGQIVIINQFMKDHRISIKTGKLIAELEKNELSRLRQQNKYLANLLRNKFGYEVDFRKIDDELGLNDWI